MKVYIARIYCPYEGTTYACGIFSTREKAEQAATWLTDHAAYFREHHHKSFGVVEYELDDVQEFEQHLQMELQFMKWSSEDDIDSEERKAATLPVLEKLSPLYKEPDNADV